MSMQPFQRAALMLSILGTLLPAWAAAQTAGAPPESDPRVEAATAWQACVSQPDAARLACFDRWAREQDALLAAIAEKPRSTQTSPAHEGAPTTQAAVVRGPVAAAQPPGAQDQGPPSGSAGIVGVGLEQGCRDRRFSDLSRFWELESGSSCPTFGLRAFHPSTISLAVGNRINRQPASPNPLNIAAAPTDYDKREMRLSVSVRTKLASGLFTSGDDTRRDSLWFAYTAQSYWQVFNSALSRPFRNTDHTPELIYVYPTDRLLLGGWRWRYSGAGLVHQSNGQSNPLSRSWNRAYLMAGLEKDHRFTLEARVWKRLPENRDNDDNPDISRYVGRGDIALGWNLDAKNALRATYTGSFNRYGSVRLEWTRSLGDGLGNSYSGLRLYTSLFHGYGDSLLDYNYRRTVFAIGLSLADF